MSTYVQDGSLFLADSSAYDVSSQYNSLIINGDTIRIVQQKNPSPTDTGYIGDLATGSVAGTSYLYYHNGSQWLRTSFSTYI